jgi:N-acetylglucosaminyldiphosphoundecaprenol N-acetyl-beta-D-mannosaminyltransferase
MRVQQQEADIPAAIGQPPAGEARSAAPDGIERITVGGIRLARLTRDQLARLMCADVEAARSGALPVPRVVTSANGSVVARYHSEADFAALIDRADIVDADGMPLVFASRIFCRNPLGERTATTDFLLDAASLAANQGIRFYFLGSRPGVAARAAEHLRSRFPDLKVVGTRSGYFGPNDIPAICAAIRDSRADVLWLGMGSPLQERFAVESRDLLAGVGWIRTCGGLFDHYGGGVSRAPDWMQAAGLEWIYRAAREPLRLGWRYLVTSPIAVYHLMTKTHD